VKGRAVIVNPAPAVARQAFRVLSELRGPAAGPGSSAFCSTGDDRVLRALVGEIAGREAGNFSFSIREL